MGERRRFEREAVAGIMLTILLLGSALGFGCSYLCARAAGTGLYKFVNEDVLIAPNLPKAFPSQVSPVPGYDETSEYLIGSVAVGVIFLESNGAIDPSTEDWNSTEESLMVSAIQIALDWWSAQNPDASVSFALALNYRVPTGYEPINNGQSNQGLWIGDAMASLGYSGDYLTQVRDYINDLRRDLGTDWAFAAFVIDSSNGDGFFADDSEAWAYLGGPFFVEAPYWPDRFAALDNIFAHEMGHIFYATDEYNGYTEYSGYLNVPDVENSGCLMYNCNYSLSAGTWGQVGWRDSDADGIQDIVDTFPDTVLNPYSPDPTSERSLAYTGTVTEIPYPNNNPQPSSTGRDVTINTINNVEFRVDSGSWINATSDDGAFDEAEENFSFVTPTLFGGPHTVEARTINSVNNVEPAYASDTITVYLVRNINTGLGYFTIQGALDDFQTQNGHTIAVDPGIYYEKVIINKMISLLGNNKKDTIIDGGGAGNVIRITANSVNITGFTIQESGYWESGVYVSSSGNNISGNIITNNGDGVYLDPSSLNIISGNNITDNGVGASLYMSSLNTISGNNITDNYWGVYLDSSNNNVFYNNNFISNIQQASITASSGNVWDNGYPSGGNYWSDYEVRYPDARELDDSGIWDTPYVIDANNQDRYPLMNLWSLVHDIAVISVAPSKTVVGQGYSTNINVTVTNQGTSAETFNITLYAQASINETDLVGYWRFDEGSGNIAYDSSGNGNNGTLVNGPTWVAGKFANALSFDGVNDYVEITENTELDPHTSNLTVSAWVNVARLTEFWDGYGFVILGKRQSEYDNSLTLLVHSGTSENSQARFGFVWDGSMQATGAQSDLMNVFEWHHVVGVRRGGELYVYVDGIEYGPNNFMYAGNYISPTTDISSSTPIRLAEHGAWAQYHSGAIDEVRIYNRALSADEVWAEYTRAGTRFVIKKETVTLGSGASTAITFAWNTTGFVKGNYIISAYATQVPFEKDTADNTYTYGTVLVTIPGDVDGDFDVDFLDLPALNNAYGTTPLSPRWDPNIDINGDNKVDALDLLYLGKNFGKSVP